jgi:signal-transduction protein with cAMP-binding, CBS, and nucleotidyltransferase domain
MIPPFPWRRIVDEQFSLPPAIRAQSNSTSSIAQKILPKVSKRLHMIDARNSVIDAATKLHTLKVDLLVVHDDRKLLAGVVTKSDIVRQLIDKHNYDPAIAVSEIMTQSVVTCSANDRLCDIWLVMKQRELRNIPVVDRQMRPIGVLNARDALEQLREDSVDEELLLEDYVMGVGYR